MGCQAPRCTLDRICRCELPVARRGACLGAHFGLLDIVCVTRPPWGKTEEVSLETVSAHGRLRSCTCHLAACMTGVPRLMRPH